MFLDIDLKPSQDLAVIDDKKNIITYGQLAEECHLLNKALPPRELIFCLCENSLGALLGYISFYDNNDIPLLLSATLEEKLFKDLLSIYEPGYVWMPEKMTPVLEGEILYKKFNYVLIKLDNDPYPVHKDLSLLLTTSGSTGSPKLVRHKYGNIESNAKTVANVFEWTSQERAICELPIQYSMGLNVVNSHLYSGGTILMTSHSLTSTEFWQFVKEQQGSSFTGVPFSYEILMKLRFTRMNLPHLTTLAEGGGKLSDKTFIALAEYAEKNDKRFFATFGTTETSARMTYLSPELAIKKCGSIGKAMPGTKLFLIDESGNLIKEPDKDGELCFKGPNVTMGYAENKEDLLKGDDFNGVYYTGDIARMDSDGCFYIVGRKKRFLKLFGLRISLDQCERLITEEFNIECVCSGDDNRMEIFITDKNHMDKVKDFISYKTGIMNSSFHINVIESIPRNEFGKINYQILNNLFSR